MAAGEGSGELNGGQVGGNLSCLLHFDVNHETLFYFKNFCTKKQQCQTTHPVIRDRPRRNVPLLYRPELPGLLRGEAVVEHPAEGQEVLAAGMEGAVGCAQDDSEREKVQQASGSSKGNENKDLQ